MEPYTVFPNKPIVDAGPISKNFLSLGFEEFWEACRYVHELPYGYNSDPEDLMILFKEKMGSCTTKHAVIATLATELELKIYKYIGIYPMTEELVTGTQEILDQYSLSYLPMVHCFLVYKGHRVDLSEGNRNGKNGPIDDLLYAERVAPDISAKKEYLRYRQALNDHILLARKELQGVDLKTVLQAREEGLALLKSNIVQ